MQASSVQVLKTASKQTIAVRVTLPLLLSLQAGTHLFGAVPPLVAHTARRGWLQLLELCPRSPAVFPGLDI